MWRVIFRCAFAALCLAAACLPIVANPREKSATGFPGWPKQWNGAPITQLPLSEWERNFNSAFPGEIAKFTDGRREFIFRWMNQGTRRVHSSSECFRGLGYAVAHRGVVRDENGARWSCFDAERGGHRLVLRERISDESSANEWSDFSAWYWSTLLGTTKGPWLAVTVVEKTR
jgi:hypothetical protein